MKSAPGNMVDVQQQRLLLPVWQQQHWKCQGMPITEMLTIQLALPCTDDYSYLCGNHSYK